MRMIDLHTELSSISLFPAKDQTATGNGTGVNITDFVGKLKLTLDSEAADVGTLDVKIQDSADNSTYADVTGATFTQVTTAAALVESIAIDTRAVKKWIRGVRTIATGPVVFSLNGVGQKQVT